MTGAYRGNDAIGHLMSDFCSSNAAEMYYREIAERVRFHKQEEGGAITMCSAFEEYGNEVRNETRTSERLSFARDLIRQNKLSLEEISAVSHLPLEQVQEIAEQLLEK